MKIGKKFVIAALMGVTVIAAGIIVWMNRNGEEGKSVESNKDTRNYAFDGSISKEVLNNYLSRAVTHGGLSASYPERATWSFDEDLRMLTNIGVKFIGRACVAWGAPPDIEAHFRQAKERNQKVHEADPDIILQACLFEIVTRGVENIPIPAWVFEEFQQEVVERNFDYDSMMYDDGRMKNMWGKDATPPDMSKLETRMYFYYMGRRYIDAGIESIHFGQYYLMNQKDPGNKFWIETLTRLRDYAKKNARRHFLLCDAHDASGGVIINGNKFMFDFGSFPTRPKEIVEEPQKCELSIRYLDSVYDKRKRGITPSGWSTDALPYLIEIDNGSLGPHPGEPSLKAIDVWNYDEITWLGLQPEEYRNEWIEYAWNWIRENAPHAYFQFPTRRVVIIQGRSQWAIGKETIPTATSVLMMTEASLMGYEEKDGVRWAKFASKQYKANTPSPNMPYGFNQEETIKRIWQEDGKTK